MEKMSPKKSREAQPFWGLLYARAVTQSTFVCDGAPLVSGEKDAGRSRSGSCGEGRRRFRKVQPRRRRPQSHGGGKTLLHRFTVVLPIVEGWLPITGRAGRRSRRAAATRRRIHEFPKSDHPWGVRSNEFGVEELVEARVARNWNASLRYDRRPEGRLQA